MFFEFCVFGVHAEKNAVLNFGEFACPDHCADYGVHGHFEGAARKIHRADDFGCVVVHCQSLNNFAVFVDFDLNARIDVQRHYCGSFSVASEHRYAQNKGEHGHEAHGHCGNKSRFAGSAFTFHSSYLSFLIFYVGENRSVNVGNVGGENLFDLFLNKIVVSFHVTLLSDFFAQLFQRAVVF